MKAMNLLVIKKNWCSNILNSQPKVRYRIVCHR